MTDPTPITGQELEEMKSRIIAAPLSYNLRTIQSWSGQREDLAVFSPSDAERINQLLLDYPRLLAEVERLSKKCERMYRKGWDRVIDNETLTWQEMAAPRSIPADLLDQLPRDGWCDAEGNPVNPPTPIPPSRTDPTGPL